MRRTRERMNGRMWLGLHLLIFSCVLVSCSVDLPSHVISKEKMERVLYDYHLAQGMAEAQGEDVDAARYIFVQKVFEKHRITEADFDSSMVWYSGHASYLDEMYKHIEARLDRESREVGLNIPDEDKYARYTAEGDTANIWQGRDFFYLQGNREANIYTIVLPADSTFRRGDYFMFRCSNRFVVQDMQREGFALLQVRYANDSVVAGTAMVNGDYELTVNIPKERVNGDWDIKSVACTFYYSFDEHRDDAFRLWIVNNPVLLRYHDLTRDTVAVEVPDTLAADTLVQIEERSRTERISPDEFRANQKVDHKIHVVQKRNVNLPSSSKRIKPSR